MRAEGDVTQMSWPAASVRGSGRDKVGLALTEVLSFHLLGTERSFSRLVGKERETTKHVDSFGVGFWIRVQFSAPPPK